MEGKSGFVILLVIVAFLSLTLAGMAGYIFLFSGSQHTGADASKTVSTSEVSEKDLTSVQLFDGKKYLNLKSADAKKMSVIQIGVAIKVLKSSESGSKESKSTPIDSYLDELREATIAYFGNMSVDEARNQSQTMEKAKKDLIKKYNTIVPPDEKTKKNLVYSIVFYDWFTQ